jgi:pyridoxal phosphate enzyme (YggS family)
MDQGTLQERLAAVRERIAAAAKCSGRGAEEITLIAVSKTHPGEAIREAFGLGVTHFGENRVQEWEGKREAVADLAGRWHLVGHLQSNKAVRAAKQFHSIDSIDDLSLAQKLDRARSDAGLSEKLRVLIEVHIAAEESKSGVEPAGLSALAEGILKLERLELRGLMCIPPYLDAPEHVRRFFVNLRELRDQLVKRLGKELPVLSMGMSHDFEVAIEEGATEVRVGSLLFGTRARPPKANAAG